MTSPFHRILCAVDFDDNCTATIRTARGLLPPGGQLFLFHAMRFPFALTRDEADLPILNAKERLREIVDEQLGKGAACEMIIEPSDDVAKSILEAARRLSAQCIVIATHARKGIDRFFLGSVAEQVVRAASCPVMTIRPQESAEHGDTGHPSRRNAE